MGLGRATPVLTEPSPNLLKQAALLNYLRLLVDLRIHYAKLSSPKSRSSSGDLPIRGSSRAECGPSSRRRLSAKADSRNCRERISHDSTSRLLRCSLRKQAPPVADHIQFLPYADWPAPPE